MKARRRERYRLTLELLEARVVLSPVLATTTSTNWSGYADYVLNSKNQVVNNTVTSVSGNWTVPTVTAVAGAKQTAYSSVWVGIDGYYSSTVEQIGTEQDVSPNGTTTYYAWYELYPKGSMTLFQVNPGDQISASVNYSGSTFTLTLSDATNKQSSTIQNVAVRGAARSSAEWIVEAPYSGGILPLANFGTVTFTNAAATVTVPTSPAGDVLHQDAINMVTSSGAAKDTTGGLSGGSFSVKWVSSGVSASTHHHHWWWFWANNMTDPAVGVSIPTGMVADATLVQAGMQDAVNLNNYIAASGPVMNAGVAAQSASVQAPVLHPTQPVMVAPLPYYFGDVGSDNIAPEMPNNPAIDGGMSQLGPQWHRFETPPAVQRGPIAPATPPLFAEASAPAINWSLPTTAIFEAPAAQPETTFRALEPMAAVACVFLFPGTFWSIRPNEEAEQKRRFDVRMN